MPAEVIMPMLGLAQETGKVVRWLHAEGDTVAKGQPLLEVETDKVTVDVESPADGTLTAIGAVEGDEVAVGTAIAYVVAPGESAAVLSPAATPTTATGVAAGNGARTAPAANGTEQEPTPARRVLASPKARRLADHHGLRIEEVAGSGPRGAVIAADVVAAQVSGGTPPDLASVDTPVSFDVSSTWRTMAHRTQASWQDVPHFYLWREIDASRLVAWRESVRRRPGYEHVTHTDLLVRIAAAALQREPRANATWVDGAVTGSAAVNVGLAVATDEGLVVPVIHDVPSSTLRAIADRRTDLVARARARTLRAADVTGGTFTISNLGMFGVDGFAAIVNAPQAAIVAVGRIADRVVVVDGAPLVRPTCVLTFSFDHRVVDGAAGARFLEAFVSLAEEPAGLVD